MFYTIGITYHTNFVKGKENEHPDWGFGSMDNIHITNVKNESGDRATYERRKQQNFGL